MKRWYIYRHGSNAANQSMIQTMLVAEVDAESEDKARELAAERVTLYHNQHLSAVDADAEDATNREIDARVRLL